MTGPENGTDRPGDKRFQFTDRRRFDPNTGARRDPAGDSAGPGRGGSPFAATGVSADPGNPANAAQSISADIAGPELEAAQQEAAERTADLQRVTAEYANYRKRIDRDREQVVLAAKATVLTEMLPVLDDVDRADAHGDLVGAFKAVADKLSGVLSKLGLQQVGAQGDPFDPALHEAVQFATSTEVTEPTVTDVLRHGYSISERLVRPAVVVVTGPAQDAESAGAAQDSAEVVDASAPEADDPSVSQGGDDSSAGRASAGTDNENTDGTTDPDHDR